MPRVKVELPNRVSRGEVWHELADKGEVKRPFDVAVEVVLRDEIFE